ncbi:MAG: response regulator transcription factor [Candidatus Nitronauta litoralis]|uniref:Response regulator transcription factor n=1 Tax=Candidatus Nitronauta litoralis TaxID=2705533 RepID=A0A7T0BXY6_9BACT|nr:MAG: response regulator transcription factor [Candidatus Nitronauta litoralis]
MKNSSDKISVMIADDHGIVRQGIEKVLSKASDIELISQAESGDEVLKKLKEVSPDVLVMDIEMPGKNAWDILSDLKHSHPRVKIIILSIFPEEKYGPRFIKGGASGYVSKSAAPTDLLKAIRKVSLGGKYVSPELADILISGIGSSKPPDDLHESLSDREFQVFIMISSGKKLKEIAEELNVGITTVSTHRARILQKMNMKSTAELIQYAMRQGLVEGPPL